MADATTAKEAKVSIKVIVDKVKKRVVYAEADHTFVDILFSFLTLPLGTIVRLLGKLDDHNSYESLGSLNNLYQSLEDFPECYLAKEVCKSVLLKPRSLSYDHCRNLALKIDDTEPIQYFVCNSYRCSGFDKLIHCNIANVAVESTGFQIYCESCGSYYTLSLKGFYLYSNAFAGGGVFVSGMETFIITDDLCVEPYTSATSIRLLTDLGITDMDHLEERTLEMSSYQVLCFLKMALLTDRPFTNSVFSKIPFPRESVVSGQNTTFDQCDLIKNEASASSVNMVLEVSVQKSTGKLLFAEAKEDFVEFLFCLLSIPLGTVIGTLIKGALSSSCMDNIFKSISNMSVGRYLKSQSIKEMLLEPHIGQQYTSKHQIFPLNCVPTRFCGLQYDKDPRVDGGLLKRSGLFIVTDDLTITQSSSFSTFDILKKLKVSPGDIERYQVSVGLKEGLSLLEVSLKSCSALTYGLKHQLKR